MGLLFLHRAGHDAVDEILLDEGVCKQDGADGDDGNCHLDSFGRQLDVCCCTGRNTAGADRIDVGQDVVQVVTFGATVPR